MQGSSQEGGAVTSSGAGVSVDAATEARVLADKLLGAGDSPDAADSGAETGADAGPEGAVSAGGALSAPPKKSGVTDPDGATGTKPGKPAEVEPNVHSAKDGAGQPEEQDSLEAVLKGRSERVKARIQEKARLSELEQRIQAAEQAAKEVQERAAKDPLGFLRGAGYTDEAIAKALLGEAGAAPGTDPVQARLDKLERLLTAKQEAEARAAQEAQAAELARGKEEVKRSFVGFVASQTDEFTHLAAYYDDSPQELAERAIQIADQYREATGRDTNFEAVARYLENDLRTRYSRLTHRQQPQPTESGKGPRGGQATLTAADAAQRPAPPKAPETEEEARKEALRLANQFAKARR